MALLTLYLRSAFLFISAFPRTIKFGKCKQNSGVQNNDVFVFDISEYGLLYKSLIDVLNVIRQPIEISQYIKVISKPNSQNYVWKIDCNIPNLVTLHNKKDDESVFEIAFTYVQLNELIFSVYKAIIPTFCVENAQAEFVHLVVHSEKDLILLTELHLFKEFLKGTPFENKAYKLHIFLTYYLEIILIVTKLKKFTNADLLPNNLKPYLI